MDEYLRAALAEAHVGQEEGGIPIGAVLVLHQADGIGRIISRGHNQRVQKGSVIRHAEMDCLENLGRHSADVYRDCTLYSTLSPCAMCSGAVLLYGIPRVVIGENHTFQGPEEYLRSQGVQLTIAQDPDCIELMRAFIAKHPHLWNEDIGV
jgi:cytosine deaminase